MVSSAGFMGIVMRKKHLITGTVGGVLVVCLFAVIHYRMCENILHYTVIQSPHPSAEKDLRTEHIQTNRYKRYIFYCQKLDNKPMYS